MQEARLAAYFIHYTNLVGSLSHQALARDSWSLWLMRPQMMLDWSLLKFTTCITIKDIGLIIDIRKLERQLRVLPDLLNRCHIADIASKVTRVRTLANMLAAAPLLRLPACLVIEVDKLVRIYRSHNPCYHCNWGKVLFCPPTHQNLYLRSTMSQCSASQPHNTPQARCPQGSVTDGLDFPTIARSVRARQWTP